MPVLAEFTAKEKRERPTSLTCVGVQAPLSVRPAIQMELTVMSRDLWREIQIVVREGFFVEVLFYSEGILRESLFLKMG